MQYILVLITKVESLVPRTLVHLVSRRFKTRPWEREFWGEMWCGVPFTYSHI